MQRAHIAKQLERAAASRGCSCDPSRPEAPACNSSVLCRILHVGDPPLAGGPFSVATVPMQLRTPRAQVTSGQLGSTLRSAAILRRSPYLRNQRPPSSNVTKLAPGHVVMPAKMRAGSGCSLKVMCGMSVKFLSVKLLDECMHTSGQQLS